jgi:putative phosphoesterase
MRADGVEGGVEVGVISDTHGLLRPEASAALQGVHHIIHAGDVGNPEIITSLERIAPVTAVRGNTDWGSWAKGLPLNEVVEMEGRSIYVLHDLEDLDLNPGAAGLAAVISGHTHSPEERWDRGVLYLNPGSAGPVRGTRPVSLAILKVREDGIFPRFLDLL